MGYLTEDIRGLENWCCNDAMPPPPACTHGLGKVDLCGRQPPHGREKEPKPRARFVLKLYWNCTGGAACTSPHHARTMVPPQCHLMWGTSCCATSASFLTAHAAFKEVARNQRPCISAPPPHHPTTLHHCLHFRVLKGADWKDWRNTNVFKPEISY